MAEYSQVSKFDTVHSAENAAGQADLLHTRGEPTRKDATGSYRQARAAHAINKTLAAHLNITHKAAAAGHVPLLSNKILLAH